jgi:WbqC-like protein family
MKIVISQSMFFPWVGLLEQIRLADIYVYYDDVQFSKGSFVNRVQIKTDRGQQWLTVPILQNFGQSIAEVAIDYRQNWQERHIQILRRAYDRANFRDEMLALVTDLYQQNHTNIGALSRASLQSIVQYFGLEKGRQFVDVATLNIAGNSSRRVLDVVMALQGTQYITGHGAAKYLDHSLFETAHIDVQYMEYQKKQYSQLHGEFTPFVSCLDLIANCGRAGRSYICSKTVSWQDFCTYSLT